MPSIENIPVMSLPYRRRSSGVAQWVNGSYNLSKINNLQYSQQNGNWRKKSDGGGPFLLTKLEQSGSPTTINSNRYQGYWVCTGGGTIPRLSGDFSPPTIKSSSSLNSLGTTAIARTLPTNPASELSVLIGETAREGIPHIIGSTAFKEQVRAAHKAGDEYLNYQFGWLPLVTSLRDFAHSVKNRDKIMRQYVKYSDRQIRRHYDFPSIERTRSGKAGGFVDNLSTDHPFTADYTDSYKEDVWFSGAFRYHIPIPGNDYEKLAYYGAEARKILGLELTPEVVWNLSPWSWAVDWFSTTGDVLHNISRLGKDGLVMRYGYIMAGSRLERTIYARGDDPSKPYTYGKSTYYREVRSVKQRAKATPYGFGLTFDGLSNTQKAIIAALGLTRAF